MILTGGMFSTKSSSKTVIVSTIIFMSLNALLPLNFSLQVEAAKYPFKLTITLEKTTYKLGEIVNVTWTLTNIGEENVTLYYSADFMPDFIIRNNNFKHVFRYAWHYAVAAIYYPLFTLAPGDSRTRMGDWEQIYDGSGNTDQILWYEQVPPGPYYISGAFRSGTYQLEFETTPLRITIGM